MLDAADWRTEWLADLPATRAVLWRGVEAQHRIATMKLVDSTDEQTILENLLESSKPPLPTGAAHVHHLISTPFRYSSRWPSRFRAPGDPGVWYGAEKLQTACAAVGYWRWRFASDSDALRDQAVVSEHTFFDATATGPVVDLVKPPWSQLEQWWMSSADYGACQRVARAAREAGASWIRYRSVRDPRHDACGAVLTPDALAIGDLTHQQTWACKVTPATVIMRPLGFAAASAPLQFDMRTEAAR